LLPTLTDRKELMQALHIPAAEVDCHASQHAVHAQQALSHAC